MAKKLYTMGPTPGIYEGVCDKCGKRIRTTEKKINMAGSPPEFPFHMRGHCRQSLEMTLIEVRKPKKKKSKKK
jgi:hypothetical protein